MKTLPLKLAFLLLPLSVGCSESFDPYEKVEGLRLLAMAADKPQLLPSDTATISALVTEDATYAWSWCPFALPSEVGSGCAISHEDFQRIAGAITVPDYDLGTGETASFSHDIPPMFYEAICEQLLSGNVPDGFDVPDCSTSFEIQISLTVSSGGESVTGVGTLELLFDSAAIPNQNPVLNGISVGEVGTTKTELPNDSSTSMKRDVLYELQLDIDQATSETYSIPDPDGGPAEEKQENLVATWFYQGGKMDKSHSSFVPGSVDIETLRANEWTPPTTEKFSDNGATLYVVVRDGRGGITWLQREIALVNP